MAEQLADLDVFGTRNPPKQPKPPKHRWSSEDRTLLAVITKFYDLSDNDISSIFNKLCQCRLAEEGFANGLPTATVKAQVADLRRTSRGIQEYRHIQSMALDVAQKVFRHQQTQVETASAELGISLKPRQHSSRPTLTKRLYSARITDWDDSDSSSEWSFHKYEGRRPVEKSKSAVSTRSRTSSAADDEPMPTGAVSTIGTGSESNSSYTDSESSGSWCAGTDTGDDEDHCQQFGKNDFSITASRMDARLRISFDNRRRKVNVHPRLLFRAFEPAHGLVPRRFLGDLASIPPPPPYDSDRFRSLAEQHLRQERFMSPFISWSQNPLRILRLIQASTTPRFLAIIDYNDYCEQLENQLGTGTGMWLVPEICRHHGFHDLEKADSSTPKRRGYTGIGEFLSWGAIDYEPVAVLGKGASLRLYHTLKGLRRTNYESGVIVAQCLRDVPIIYREVVTKSLLLAFRKLDRAGGPAYREFVRGVYGEPRQLLSESVGLNSVTEDDWEMLSNTRSSADDSELSDAQELISFKPIRQPNLTVEIARVPTLTYSKTSDEKEGKEYEQEVQQGDEEDVWQDLVDAQLAREGGEYVLVGGRSDYISETETDTSFGSHIRR